MLIQKKKQESRSRLCDTAARKYNSIAVVVHVITDYSITTNRHALPTSCLEFKTMCWHGIIFFCNSIFSGAVANKGEMIRFVVSSTFALRIVVGNAWL